jgi:hypothetical protein
MRFRRGELRAWLHLLPQRPTSGARLTACARPTCGPFVVRFAERWNGRDLEGLLSLYDEAAEMTDPLLAEPIRGRDALRRYYLELVFGPHPGARLDVIAATAEADEVVFI